MNARRDTDTPFIIGIDPAPAKESTAYDGTRFHAIPPQELRTWLEEQQRQAGPSGLLVAWDAPLTVDRAYTCPRGNHMVGYYRREFDDVVRRWVAQWSGKRLEEKAVGVGHLAGVPHWVLTCDVLGLPFGTPYASIARGPEDVKPGSVHVVEVHPAVSLAVWWLEFGCWKPMPRYKGAGNEGGEGLETLVRRLRSRSDLEIPDECVESDDKLDAWVAWRMAHDFVHGGASWAGCPDRGGYILPDSASSKKVGLRWEPALSR